VRGRTKWPAKTREALRFGGTTLEECIHASTFLSVICIAPTTLQESAAAPEPARAT
jgi:hypothetical protein